MPFFANLTLFHARTCQTVTRAWLTYRYASCMSILIVALHASLTVTIRLTTQTVKFTTGLALLEDKVEVVTCLAVGTSISWASSAATVWAR
jgi:hypothetical protein